MKKTYKVIKEGVYQGTVETESPDHVKRVWMDTYDTNKIEVIPA